MSDTRELEKELITYALRYGGPCRGCADEDGTCPTTGIPCDPEVSKRVLRRAFAAWEYGSAHGYCPPLSATERAAREAAERERDGWRAKAILAANQAERALDLAETEKVRAEARAEKAEAETTRKCAEIADEALEAMNAEMEEADAALGMQPAAAPINWTRR